MVVLERMKLVKDSLAGKLDFATKVKEKLGYVALLRATSNHRLLDILEKLDAMPYDPKAVESYKRSKRKATQEALDIANAVPMGARNAPDPYEEPQMYQSWAYGQVYSYSHKVCGWKVEALEKYTEAIPESVLALAMKIKEKAEKAGLEVGFKVHALVESTRTLDPFLSVNAGQESYYVAVWDEPTFYG